MMNKELMIDRIGAYNVKRVKELLAASQSTIDMLDKAFDRECRIIEQKIAVKKEYDGLRVA